MQKLRNKDIPVYITPSMQFFSKVKDLKPNKGNIVMLAIKFIPNPIKIFDHDSIQERLMDCIKITPLWLDLSFSPLS